MENLTMENLLPQANNSVYSLVRMASKRALELADGKPPLVDTKQDDKVTSISLKEIAKKKVVLKEVADQFLPEETSKIKSKQTSEEETV